MFAIRKGNTITIAPLEDALVGLQSGWAIRFADKPQFLFHISRMNLDGSKMTMNQAIENCARIARREGLDLRSNACNAQVFELATACDYCDSIQNMTGTRNCPIHKDTMPEYPIPAELAVRTLTVAQYTGHKEE